MVSLFCDAVVIFAFTASIKCGVAESGHDFTKFSTISQWFQTLTHPALMQRLKCLLVITALLNQGMISLNFQRFLNGFKR
ncbi:MAG: hypothetical protein HRU34_15175 [Richelia sp.]|nr:hypothetical protein [Richelia sp.]